MLINCVAYEEGRKLADIDKRDIRNYLARPGCFVWVALRDATEEELTEMQAEFELHPLAVEDARHGHQRPKIEEYGDLLFVVVNTVDAVGDRFFPVLDAVETELESIEAQLFSAKDPRSTIETLYYVKQKLTTLKH